MACALLGPFLKWIGLTFSWIILRISVFAKKNVLDCHFHDPNLSFQLIFLFVNVRFQLRNKSHKRILHGTSVPLLKGKSPLAGRRCCWQVTFGPDEMLLARNETIGGAWRLDTHDCRANRVSFEKNALAGLDRQAGFAFQQSNLCSMENQYLRFVPRLKSDKQKY